MVRLAILLLCLLPVGAGLLGAVLPAFGWFPPLGGMHFSFQPFADFLAEPGLRRSLWLSLSIAFVSTFLSYWLAIFLLALIY
ncbi:MAG: ABC transporter permease, partial [Alphaproteobacteria bacterium]|nr:ABC transporter permease [Alphaproteobacteria bacterium]